MKIVEDPKPTLLEQMKEQAEKSWQEFKVALIADLPPFMLPAQQAFIIESHKAAFDLGAMTIIEGLSNVSKEAEVLTEGRESSNDRDLGSSGIREPS